MDLVANCLLIALLLAKGEWICWDLNDKRRQWGKWMDSGWWGEWRRRGKWG